jgi:ABC-type glycerol-3-phosphate transport system substrate-binding protein
MAAHAMNRRRYLRWMGLAAAASPLAACAPGSAPADTTRSAAPAKLMWQTPESTEIYIGFAREQFALFQQKYPQITFETMGGGGNNEVTLTALVAGQGPDIMASYPPQIWELVGKGQIMNHNDFVKDLKKAQIDDFWKYMWEGTVIPSTNFRYGFGADVDMDLLYYNKEILRRRGAKEPTADWTRDDYALALRQCTFMDGEKQIWGGFKPMTTFSRFQNLVTGFGGHVVDPKDLTKTQLHLPEAQNGLEWARARVHDDKSWAPLTTGYSQGTDMVFPNGQLAMMEVGTGRFARIARAMQQTQWDIQHIPKGSVKRTAFADTDVWAMWKNTRAKDAAWLWMQHLITPEFNNKAMLVNNIKVPPLRSGIEVWIKTLRDQIPTVNNVNMKVVTDALGTLNYHSPNENFLCQTDAGAIVVSTLNQIFREGTARPSVFRDIREQIDLAAKGCGLTIK